MERETTTPISPRGTARRAPGALLTYALACTLALAAATCGSERGSGGGRPGSSHPVPFRAHDDYLAYWDGERYVPFYMKGINLGVGIPGSEPGQLAVTRDQYRRWLEQIGAMGVNTLRVYTLHFPRFYEEFRAYNERYPDRPLYLVQGIWLDEENPTHDFWNMTELYDHEIRDVVDALHGNATVVGSYGKAFGEYTVDVSPWVLSWVIGREIYPDEVEFTNEQHAEVTSYEGHAVSIRDAMPMEAWLAARIDLVIHHERSNYGVQRPVCYSSWPTLDPMIHEIEGHGSDEDRVNMALHLDLHDAPGGYWIIYHAYPYYPDFIVEDPAYQRYSDPIGPNSYLGYLFDLKSHYPDTPVVIGEFGTPSSWGAAHYAQNGMHHGGLDETVVGHFASRMLFNFYDAGLAGGIYFAWMDEWWKRTWITDELDFPRNRRFRWHNVTAAEQNFGLLAFDLPEPTFERWPTYEGGGPIRTVDADVDAEFFHVRVGLGRPIEPDERLTIAWDTYRDDLGETVLPDGSVTTQRSEFVTLIDGDRRAEHFVTRAYDSYGIWHNSSADHQLFHSAPTDGDGWVLVRWKNNQRHVSLDGTWEFPETADEIGQLHVRDDGEERSNLDAVVYGPDWIEVRIPWTLLHFTDPSRLSVLDDDRNTRGREIATSEGVRLTVRFDGDSVQTDRLAWDGWEEAPPVVEREKPSFRLFAEGVLALPDALPSFSNEDRPEVAWWW